MAFPHGVLRLALTGLAVLCPLGSALHPANRLFVVSTSLEEGKAGQEIIIACENTSQVSAFSVALKFNPAVLQVDAIDVTGAAAEAPWKLPAANFLQYVKNTTGEVSYGALLHFDSAATRFLPPAARNDIIKLTVTVAPGKGGTSTVIDFSDSVSIPQALNVLTVLPGYTSIRAPALVLADGTIPITKAPPIGLRGDANGDGIRDISDAVSMLGCQFLGEPCPTTDCARDFNIDGGFDISDPVALLGFLFLGDPEPPPCA